MRPSPLIRLLILAHLSLSFSAAHPIGSDDEGVALENKALVDSYLATVNIAPRDPQSTADMVSLDDIQVLAVDKDAAPSPTKRTESEPDRTHAEMQKVAAESSTSTSSAPSGGGLGSGAMAGIVVVVVLLVLGAIGCAVFFFVIRNRRKRRAAEDRGIHPVFVTPRSRTRSDASVTVIGDGDDYDKDAQFVTADSVVPCQKDVAFVTADSIVPCEKDAQFVTTVSEVLYDEKRSSVHSNRSSISTTSTIQHPENSYDYRTSVYSKSTSVFPDPSTVYANRNSVHNRNSVSGPNDVTVPNSIYNNRLYDRHSCYRDSYFPAVNETPANMDTYQPTDNRNSVHSMHSIKSTMLDHNGWLNDQRSSIQSFHSVQSTPSMRVLTHPLQRRNTISTIASDDRADYASARRPTSMQSLTRRPSAETPRYADTLTISTASGRASLAETRTSIALSPAFNQVITLTPATMTPATPYLSRSPNAPSPHPFPSEPLPPLPPLPALPQPARPLPTPRANTLPSTVYVQPVQARPAPAPPLRIQIAEPVASPESPSPISSGSSLFSPTALIPPAPFARASDEIDRRALPAYDSPHTERLRSDSDGSSIQEHNEHRY